MKLIPCLFLGLSLIACKSETKEEKSPADTSRQASETAAPTEEQKSITRGAEIYRNFCASCHLPSGEGIANAFPPLNSSDWLVEKRRESISAVKHGLKGPIEVNGKEYNSVMTNLGLTDQEVADVMNYIFTAWDNNISPPVTTEEVSGI